MKDYPKEIQNLYDGILNELKNLYEVEFKSGGVWITRNSHEIILWYDRDTWGPSIWFSDKIDYTYSVILMDSKYLDLYKLNRIRTQTSINDPNLDIIGEIKQWLGENCDKNH